MLRLVAHFRSQSASRVRGVMIGVCLSLCWTTSGCLRWTAVPGIYQGNAKQPPVALPSSLTGLRENESTETGLLSKAVQVPTPVQIELEIEKLPAPDSSDMGKSKADTLVELFRTAREETSPENIAAGTPSQETPQLFSTTRTTGDTSIDLAIENARAASLANNLSLRAELVQPEIARASVDAEAGRFQQVFTAAVFHGSNDPPPGNFSFGAQERQDVDLFYSPFSGNSLVPTINVPLTTGGNVSFENGMTRLDGESFDPTYDAHTAIGLSQPLFRGRGTEVNTAGIRLAHVDLSAANATAKLATIRILADTELAYWDLYVAHNLRLIAIQHVALANKQFEIAQKLLDARIVSSVDVDRANAGLLIRQQRLVDSDTSYQLAVRRLKQVMQDPAFDVRSTIELIPVTAPSPMQPDIDRAAIIDLAVNQRMELVIQELEILRAAIDRMVQQNSSLPRLDLTTRYALLGTGNSFSDAISTGLDDGFSQWFIGLAGELPLFNGVNQSAAALARQANSRRLQATLNRDNVRVVVSREVLDAADQLERSYRVLQIAARTVMAAENALKGEFELYSRGLRTSTDVLIADQLLIDAQTSQIQALGDFGSSKAQLALASGTVLGYAGVLSP